jgi:hypothetical protein
LEAGSDTLKPLAFVLANPCAADFTSASTAQLTASLSQQWAFDQNTGQICSVSAGGQ